MLSRSALVVLALALVAPTLVAAQQEPLAAGSDGVPVPKKKKHVQPVYPPDALAQGIRGIVILDLIIDTEGRVVETHIIRSIPGLDEAALAAVTQWTYNPVKVDGEPVSVRLTVPITFALRLPEMNRQAGIPPLRQGVTPPWPEEGVAGGTAVADVTLEPDGRIGLARILEGEEPWSTALLEALRTWRFSAPPDDTALSFQVAAEFVPGRGRDRQGTVRLDLRSLRETALFDAPPEEPVAVAEFTPEPEPPAEPERRSSVPPEPSAQPVGAEPEARPTGPETEEPAPETTTEVASEPAPATGSPATEGDMSPTAPLSPTTSGGEDAPPDAAAPEGLALARPAGSTPPSSDAGPATSTPVARMDPTAPPPIETLSVAPPPLPPENGISAIRGVQLEPGVADLIRGRRPVSPPLARMAAASGVVEVDFSVSAGGITTVQRADGPELLRPAAVSAVESWVFRRTRADRAYLTAVFSYEDDLASAIVRPQPSR